MMMQTHQMMPLRRFAQGLGEQLKLAVLQKTGNRSGNSRIKHRDPPIADVNDRFADNPALAKLNEYGTTFFDLAPGRAAGILAFFAFIFLALAWSMLVRGRRRG